MFGIYNVGWVGVRNDPDGIAVIKWWREKCIEWCHDYVDGDRFADQGYLDSFSRLSTRVKSSTMSGPTSRPGISPTTGSIFATAGSWSMRRPLIFFHFQGLEEGCGWFIFNSHRIFGAPFSPDIREHIYQALRR